MAFKKEVLDEGVLKPSSLDDTECDDSSLILAMETGTLAEKDMLISKRLVASGYAASELSSRV